MDLTVIYTYSKCPYEVKDECIYEALNGVQMLCDPDKKCEFIIKEKDEE